MRACRYFKDPPQYQILHCLRNRVSGGASIFVDALQAAEELRQTSPAEFEVLAETPVSFHYINDGHHLHYEHPTIELSFIARPKSSIDGASFSTQTPIAYINYSPPFMAPLFADTPLKFYDAFKKYTALLRRPQNSYIYTLKEGDAVLFDNRRVLHARTAFMDAEARTGGPEETNRWLKGCYLETDALLDRIRVLRTKLEAGQS
jgi:gamma-butyrobetaine dioxygenase